MKKRITALLTSLAFGITLATTAVAASVTCTVESIENGQVLLSCGQLAEKIKVGEKVKVRTKTARKAIEGC